jgi:hypothetical protein
MPIICTTTHVLANKQTTYATRMFHRVSLSLSLSLSRVLSAKNYVIKNYIFDNDNMLLEY